MYYQGTIKLSIILPVKLTSSIDLGNVGKFLERIFPKPDLTLR